MAYIYILIDPLTDDVRYCGKTNNIKVRIAGHLKEKRSNKDKMDWVKNLKSQKVKPKLCVIDEVSDEDWSFWEKYWISQLKCWGFDLLNKTNGGESGVTGFKHTKEARRKISEKQKGRTMSLEWRKNISLSKKGVKFSKKHKLNLSLSHKGNVPSNIEHVYQIDINSGNIIRKHDSIFNALKSINVSVKSGLISVACKGDIKSAYGYYWCYADKYDDFVYKEYHRIDNPILQYDNNGNFVKEYFNITEAARENDLIASSISHALTDTPSYSGFIWIYKKGDVDKILKSKLKKIKREYILKQVDLENNIVNEFSSIKEAQDETNIKHISCVLNGRRNSAGGYTWVKEII